MSATPRLSARAKKKLWTALRFAAACAITAAFLFPVYWVFITALKNSTEIYAIPPVWFPEELHFDNFTGMFSRR